MKIAVTGLGYVGLPLVLAFASKRLSVVGIDIDKQKVESITQGKSYIRHIKHQALEAFVRDGLLHASTDFSEISDADAVLICVPTPLSKHREPDLSYVISTAQSIGPHLKKGMLVVLESTTYPGTTEDELRPILEQSSGLVAGKDFYLAYSPEREDPGNKNYELGNVPKLIGGYTGNCLQKAVELYSKIVNEIVPVSSCRVAEATKLMENIFRSVNIALVNELKIIYDGLGIDIWEVIAAAKTKPYGFMPFYPGPGLGGHCIPIDPFYLTWKAKEIGHHTRFIELAGEINSAMPAYVVNQIVELLNSLGKPVRGAKILILGIAYKPDVDDYRETPAFPVMEKLNRLEAELSFHDPYVPEIKETRQYPHFKGLQSVDVRGDFDCAVLITDHSQFKGLVLDIPCIDTRNCLGKSQSHHLMGDLCPSF